MRSTQQYRPPPLEETGPPETFKIYPTGDPEDPHILVVRMLVYRGLCVDYSINQIVLLDDVSRDVARIDCCHSRVHRHQFDQLGNDLLKGDVIMEIPAEGAWEAVHKSYAPSLGLMEDEWEQNYRRWRGDRG